MKKSKAKYITRAYSVTPKQLKIVDRYAKKMECSKNEVVRIAISLLDEILK